MDTERQWLDQGKLAQIKAFLSSRNSRHSWTVPVDRISNPKQGAVRFVINMFPVRSLVYLCYGDGFCSVESNK